MVRKSRQPVLFLGVVLLALTAIVGISQWRAAHAKDRIPWRTDLAAAEIEAKAQHKRVLAYFTATWCGPCHELARTTWADADVAKQIEKRFVPVKIDVDADRPTALAYAIEAMPTYIVLNDRGEPVSRESGYLDEAAMLDWLGR